MDQRLVDVVTTPAAGAAKDVKGVVGEDGSATEAVAGVKELGVRETKPEAGREAPLRSGQVKAVGLCAGSSSEPRTGCRAMDTGEASLASLEAWARDRWVLEEGVALNRMEEPRKSLEQALRIGLLQYCLGGDLGADSVGKEG